MTHKPKVDAVHVVTKECEHNWIAYEWLQEFPHYAYEDMREHADKYDGWFYPANVTKLLCTNCLLKKDVRPSQ